MANDFSQDSNIKAVWRFEQNGNDSKGENHLTEFNAPGYSNTDFKEGAYSTVLESASTNYFEIADADLDSNFPMKNGDVHKLISIGVWFKISTGNYGILCSKFDNPNNKMSFIFYYAKDKGSLVFAIGYNDGQDLENAVLFASLVTGRWYYGGLTHNDATKAWTAYLWDDVTQSYSTNSGVFTNNIFLCDIAFRVGALADNTLFYDGKQDELIIANRIISNDEWDLIRQGLYSYSICLCTDLLDDVFVKFELIYELAQNLLTLILARIKGGSGDEGRRLRRIVKRGINDSQDIIEILEIIMASGVLN